MKKKVVINIVVAIFLLSIIIWTAIHLINKNKPKEWPDQKVELMINQCVQSSPYVSFVDTSLRYDICRCAIEKIVEEYTYEEIVELNKLQKDTISKLVTPIYQDCMFPTLYRENYTIINDTSQLKWICDSIVDTWKPTDNDLRIAESILETAIIESSNSYWTLLSVKTAKKYYRQYSFFIDQNGNRIIYINAFCELLNMPVDSSGVMVMKPFDWKNTFMIVDDGGDCFWSIQINLTTMDYFKLHVNGV
jgi:hypothetical protein